MNFIDYYKVLQIQKNASESEIKKAYRKLARKYHPDVNSDNKDAEKEFKRINEANEVLGNPENRAKYDKYGENWKHADQLDEQANQQKQYQNFGGSGSFNSQNFNQEDFSDFFGSMFGGGNSSKNSRQNQSFKGQDYETTLEVELKETFESHKKTINVNGKKIRFTLPRGIKNEQTIKIKGYGGESPYSGPKGDLHITFNIINNTTFKVDGNNLYLNKEIDLFTAVLGDKITVETLDSKVKLNIKAGTQSNSQVRLKGKGLPVYKTENNFGDLVINYIVKIPTKLSDKEKSLFENLKKESSYEK